MDKVSDYISNVKGAFDTWKDALEPLNDEYLADIDTTLGNITTTAGELAKQAEEDVIPKLSTELDEVLKITTAYGGLKDSVGETVTKFEGLVGQSIIVIQKLAEMKTQAEQTAQAINTAYVATPPSTSSNGDGGDGDNPNQSPSISPGGTPQKSMHQAGTYSGQVRTTLSSSDSKIVNGVYYTRVLINGTDHWIKNTDMAKGEFLGGNSSGAAYKVTNVPKYQYYDTGGYTGEWGPYGKVAMLHEKELILNKHDTENFLASMEILHRILEIIDLQSMSSQIGGILSSPAFNGMDDSVIEQNVHIEASFPNATNHSEIEEAFNNLINTASQYANRK